MKDKLMESTYKRILSIALVFGFLCSIFPTPVGFSARALGLEYPGANASVVYDFVNCLSRSNEYVDNLLEYDPEKNTNWAYYGYKDDISGRVFSYYGVLRINSQELGEWAAFRIKAPEDGKYQASMTYALFTETGSCKTAEVYLLPGDTAKTEIDTAIATVEPIATVDYAMSETGGRSVVEFGELELVGQTDYILVLMPVEVVGDNVPRMNITGLFFEGEEPVEYPGAAASVDYDFVTPVNQSSREYISGEPSWLEYNEQKNTNWAYYGFRPGVENLDKRVYSNNGTLFMNSTAATHWCSFRIKAPTDGKYKMKIAYKGASNLCISAHVFVMPVNTPLDKIYGLTSVYAPVGVVYYEQSGENMAELGEVELAGREEYLLVFIPNETATGRFGMNVSVITLSGIEFNILESITSSIIPTTIFTGESGAIKVMGLMSDGTTVTKQSHPDMELSFSSEDESIATVDDEGTVTGVSEGDAIINITATLGNQNVYTQQIVQIRDKPELDYPGASSSMYYDFVNGLARSNEYIDNLTEYNSNKNINWAYVGFAGGLANKVRSYYGALRADITSLDQWFALRIESPQEGKYQAYMEYYTSKNTAASISAYLLPGATEFVDIPSLLTEATKVGDMPDYRGGQRYGYIGEVECYGQESYILVLKPNGLFNDEKPGIQITKLILDGEEPSPLDYIELSLPLQTARVGDSLQSTINAILENGLPADLQLGSPAKVTYFSSDETVAKISEDGIVTGISQGYAEISVTVSRFGVEKSATCTISFVEFNGADSNFDIDFAGILNDGEYVNQLLEYIPGKNHNWIYFTNYAENQQSAFKTDGTIRIIGADEDAWTAFKIRPECSGIYQVKLSYRNHSGARGAKLYLLPGETSKYEIGDLINSISPLGTFEYTESEDEVTVPVGEACVMQGEEYLLVLAVNKAGIDPQIGIGTMSVSGVSFVGEPPEIISVSLNYPNSKIPVGGKMLPRVSGVWSSSVLIEDIFSLSGASIGFVVDQEEVLSINAITGEVTALSGGEATVTVTVNTGTKILIAEQTLEVLSAAEDHDYPGDSATTHYNFVNGLARNSEYIDPLTEYNPEKNTNWVYYAFHNGAENKARSYYGTLRIDTSAAGDWVAFKIKAPQDGRYQARMTYIASANMAPAAKIYLLPGTLSVAEITAALTEDKVLGYVEHKRELDLGVQSVYIGEVEISGQIEYILVFRVADKDEKTAALHITEFILDGATPLSSISASIIGADGSMMRDVVLDVNEQAKISLKTLNNPIELECAEITYESVTPDILSVDELGIITALGVGVGKIKITIKYEGYERIFELEVVCGSVKSRRSLFTDEKVKNARENIKKYSWAKNLSNATCKQADKYVDKAELLWSLVTTQELPRSSHVGLLLDPEHSLCPYCRVNIYNKYGTNSWIVDAFKNPWKVKCPDCKRSFPSNDFGAFYESGLDENRNYRYELALANGSEYLVNVLYPEKGVGWGVDDGWGFDTGKVFPNGVRECKTFVSAYNSNGLWNTQRGVLSDALEKLYTAYLYTGEAKYGRTGAILLDRIADVYPDMDLDPYPEFYNGSYELRGKVLGLLRDYNLGLLLARSYDALWPAMDDPYVIDFLTQKAEKYKFKNSKSNAQLIRYNNDNGILRAINDAIRTRRIQSNFGHHQLVMATAAVVLDTLPETKEWIDWVFRSLTSEETTRNSTGGYVQAQLINEVDRDGHGNEAAPAYNSGWVTSIMLLADALEGYDKYPEVDLYKHPKVLRMFSAIPELICSSRYTPTIGDSGRRFGVAQFFATKNALMKAIQLEKGNTYSKTNMARMLYLLNGRDLTDLHEDIFTKDPEKVKQIVSDEIADGEMAVLDSNNLAGYGFMVLRDGVWIEANSEHNSIDTQRAFWMYYGRNTGHGQRDKLNLGIHAYGLDLAPDFGNPVLKGIDANRAQWVSQPLSHNTVLINQGKNSDGFLSNYTSQNKSICSTPLHFDDSGRVKLMDVDAPEIHDDVEIFRRTIVSVDVNDDVSYAIDFFRILGGNDHIYSFHAQSKEVDVLGAELIPQVNNEGDYVGSYAGVDVPYGPDPLSSSENWEMPLLYPPGFTWLYDIDKGENPQGEFISADFKITDFNNILSGNYNLHLRLTMLNDAQRDDSKLNEFTVASCDPPQFPGVPRGIKKILARRTGDNLDTLFTSVIEPYCDEPYINKFEGVPIVPISGYERRTDKARAVKVTLSGGREDYIIYTTNNTVKYRIDNKLDFQGFVGVYSIKGDEVLLAYVNDGTTIGEHSGIVPAYTGIVEDFSHELTTDNWISVIPGTNFDEDDLIGRYIYVETDGDRTGLYNGCFKIESVERQGETVRLGLGNTTLIRALADEHDADAGYLYYIKKGANFRIPIGFITKYEPIFRPIPDYQVDANSEIRFKVEAESPKGLPLTYSAPILPRGAQFYPESQLFVWRPESSQQGKNVVVFQASDGSRVTEVKKVINVLGSTISRNLPSLEEPLIENSSIQNENVNSENPDILSPDTNTSMFRDLEGYDWAQGAILKLADLGIFRGVSDGVFAPGVHISRADFTILLVRVFNLKEEGEEQFTDVSPERYYASDIAIARKHGIALGMGDNKYKPEEKISRQDMMVMLYRAFEASGQDMPYTDKEILEKYLDASQISDYAIRAVCVFTGMKVIQGDKNYIKPKDYATRAEVAVMLERVINTIKI